MLIVTNNGCIKFKQSLSDKDCLVVNESMDVYATTECTFYMRARKRFVGRSSSSPDVSSSKPVSESKSSKSSSKILEKSKGSREDTSFGRLGDP